MARVTSGEVQEILAAGGDYDLVKVPVLTPYIRIANNVTTRIEACAIAKDKTLTASELGTIEGWLAAHFYVMSDQAFASKNTQGASASFQGQYGMHLDASKYGQSAQMADYSGCLAALALLNKRTTIRGYWLGKPPSEQIDYKDRD